MYPLLRYVCRVEKCIEEVFKKKFLLYFLSFLLRAQKKEKIATAKFYGRFKRNLCSLDIKPNASERRAPSSIYVDHVVTEWRERDSWAVVVVLLQLHHLHFYNIFIQFKNTFFAPNYILCTD